MFLLEIVPKLLFPYSGVVYRLAPASAIVTVINLINLFYGHYVITFIMINFIASHKALLFVTDGVLPCVRNKQTMFYAD